MTPGEMEEVRERRAMGRKRKVNDTPWLHRGPFRLRGQDSRPRGRGKAAPFPRADYKAVSWRYGDDQRTPSPPSRRGGWHRGAEGAKRRRRSSPPLGLFVDDYCRPMGIRKRKHDDDEDDHHHQPAPQRQRYQRHGCQSVVVNNDVKVG